MEIGVMSSLAMDGRCFEHVQQFGLKVCQLNCWGEPPTDPAVAEAVKAESARTGVRVCAVWAGYTGPSAWNFTEGPITLGVVPVEYRAVRVAQLKGWADFAKAISAPAISKVAAIMMAPVIEIAREPTAGPTLLATSLAPIFMAM